MTAKSLLAPHWMREHPDRFDLPHIEAMQYKSVKLFLPAWNNADFCRDLLTVLPGDSYILARDHALSEQKEDMWRDPEAAGIGHANQWIDKVRTGQYHLPTDRSFFLGINEPDADSGDRDKIDRYTASFLDRLASNGLRGGAFNFSTGHPRTVDGTPHTPADYSVFERSHQAIVAGHHIGVLHIYGTGAVPCAPGHYDRLKACTWQDVEWVVGEFGVDEYVIGGKKHAGYQEYFNGRLSDYCQWLDTAIMGVNDPRIHSYCMFTYDFAHPWSSWDVHPIRTSLESYQWQHMAQAQTQPPTVFIPVVGTGDAPAQPQQKPTYSGIIDPLVARAILQIESGGQMFGPTGKPIIRFEAHIFRHYLANDALWSEYFQVDPNVPWTNQMWRQSPGGPWKQIHTGNQADEWAAFTFALSLNADAATKAISMGAPQIMGFNAERVGWPNAAAMLNAFQDASMQTLGFINYVLGDPQLTQAVHDKNWRMIATLYNGTGNVDSYSALLQRAYQQQLGAA